jgi:hypothetical protein
MVIVGLCLLFYTTTSNQWTMPHVNAIQDERRAGRVEDLIRESPATHAQMYKPQSADEIIHLIQTTYPDCEMEAWAIYLRAHHTPDEPMAITYLTNFVKQNRQGRHAELTASPYAADWPLGATAALLNIPMVVLGWGKKWKGFQDKIDGMLHAFRLFHARQLLLFADGTDCLFSGNLSVVSRLYQSKQQEVHTIHTCLQ